MEDDETNQETFGQSTSKDWAWCILIMMFHNQSVIFLRVIRKYCDVKHVNSYWSYLKLLRICGFLKDVQLTNVCFVKFHKWQNWWWVLMEGKSLTMRLWMFLLHEEVSWSSYSWCESALQRFVNWLCWPNILSSKTTPNITWFPFVGPYEDESTNVNATLVSNHKCC
jgi:hypothetical protein